MKEIRTLRGVAISTWICAGISFVGWIVLIYTRDYPRFGLAPVLAVIFSLIGLLATCQYRLMRAVDEKFKSLQATLGRGEEAPTSSQ